MTANCRHCQTPLKHSLVDLGMSPLANSYVPLDQVDGPHPTYPLHARVCENCWLVQVDDVVEEDEIFNEDYAYFSSYSEGWLAHCKAYADRMTSDLGLGRDSLVIEIASNDGYLLQYFAQNGVPVLGVEPTKNTANAAALKGVPSYVEFWTNRLATELKSKDVKPDLICSANVLAHVPDINDFVDGLATLLTGDAIYTVEFPHLLNMIKLVQFDTIYHEHYSYLSLIAVEGIFKKAGLRVFDVEEVPTHGGSLRVFACLDGASHQERAGVAKVRNDEKAAGFDTVSGYEGFTARVEAVRDGVLDFLQTAKEEGRSVAAYGAAAKGNTLLNYCAVGPDLLPFCVDKNTEKQDTLLPGSLIPVKSVEALIEAKPDYVFILPWNLRDEIVAQLQELAKGGTKFVTAVPEIRVT